MSIVILERQRDPVAKGWPDPIKEDKLFVSQREAWGRPADPLCLSFFICKSWCNVFFDRFQGTFSSDLQQGEPRSREQRPVPEESPHGSGGE